MPNYIYALHCPIANTVRYIGKSNNPQERLAQHIYFAKTGRSNHHAARWIRKILAAGFEPTLDVFYEVKHDEDWREAERFWIAEAESFGWSLTNTTAGGDGVEINCPIALENWKNSVKARWQDPLLRKQSSDKLSAYYATQQGKANKIRTSREPSKIEASRKGQIGNWQNSEYREALMRSKTAPEVIAKQAEGARNQWADPSVRQKMIDGLRKAQRARWARDGLTAEQKEERHQAYLAKRREKRKAEKLAALSQSAS